MHTHTSEKKKRCIKTFLKTEPTCQWGLECSDGEGINSRDLVWFSLVYLFNGISTFVGYLMPKPFS